MLSDDHLEPISKIAGFQGAAVYTSDGQLIISKATDANLDIDRICALAVELFKATRGITEGMEIGIPDTITVKTDMTLFIHTCIITGVAGIGVVLDLNGNVGLAQLTLKQLAKEFKPAFA
jgi:predicted regulator of Ras-like GTPase activity (Roadblock/LC7/MglB family)